MWKILMPVSLIFLAACATTSEGSQAPTDVEAAANETVLIIRRQGNRFVEQQAAGDIADSEKVCRVDSPTGTRIREVVCRTRAEWQTIQAEGRRFMELRQTGTADGG